MFAEVARLGSFTAAERELQVVQSAASATMAALETELG
ncbi:LysR family transcriptional regulator [Schumannella sp. 10F1B-5-1]